MIEQRDGYLSHEGDSVGIDMALEKIWLDWKSQQLIKPKLIPIGVDQAVYQILSEVQALNKEVS